MMSHARWNFGISVLLIMLGLPLTEAAAPMYRITIETESPYFMPAVAHVPAGSAIRWDNPTATYHTVTHDGCVTGAFCLFNSGSVPPNGAYTIPGLPPGHYSYHCQLHPIMRGRLIIESHSAAPPATTL